MAGYTGLKSRIKKCRKIIGLRNNKPKVGVVYFNENGDLLWEEGVEYNDCVLAVPLEMGIDEWEEMNIRNDAIKANVGT